jgi:uncharacterized membrane protein
MNTLSKLLCLLVLLPVLVVTTAVAKEYEIPRIHAEYSIASDGTVTIIEHRSYTFDGSFSWADYRLPLDGFTDIENIRVREEGELFINENSENPGTFSVSKDDSRVVVQWYFEAEDEERTFTVSYELKGALVTGNEWTEFFWTFAGDDRPKPTENFTAEITFPQAVDQNSTYVWDLTPDNKTNLEFRDGKIMISGSNIGRRQPVEARFLVPSSFFDPQNNMIPDPELTLQQVQQEEEERQERELAEAERKAWFEAITPNVVILLTVLSVGFFVLVYKKYGQRHSTATISDRETVFIPGKIRAAIIGRLLTANQTSGNHLTATIFDLARRGWFRIEESEKEKSFFSQETSEFQIVKAENSPDDRDLTEWEKNLIDFLNMKIAKGQDTFKALFQEDATEAAKWYGTWKKQIKEDFESRNWMDKNSYKGAIINFVLQFPLVVLSVYFLVQGGPISLISMVTSVMFAVASFSIIKRTPEGEEVHARWTAYKKGLANADERTIRMEVADRHFIYATAFHLGKEQISKLMEQTNPDSSSGMISPWIVLLAGSNSTPASIASSLATLSSSGSTSFGGTGGGAGAVSGSAGGGASGGAG